MHCPAPGRRSSPYSTAGGKVLPVIYRGNRLHQPHSSSKFLAWGTAGFEDNYNPQKRLSIECAKNSQAQYCFAESYDSLQRRANELATGWSEGTFQKHMDSSKITDEQEAYQPLCPPEPGPPGHWAEVPDWRESGQPYDGSGGRDVLLKWLYTVWRTIDWEVVKWPD